MLFDGENKEASNDSNVKGAVSFYRRIDQSNVFKTGSYGFVNGFWNVRLIKP
jgi:hypothetical protein